MKPLAPAVVAEFIGTFALCFFGIGATVATGGNLIAVALAHGLALAVFISPSMYISGGVFNPAVSIGLILAGKLAPSRAAIYIATQIAGAIAGAYMVKVLLGDSAVAAVKLGATSGTLTELGYFWKVLGFEAICSFALMFVVMGAAVDERAHKLGGFSIGLTVTMCILAAGPYTGASMNPARTLGPAVAGGYWTMWYVYMIGPVLGASLAALVYRLFWVDRWSKPT